MVVRILICDDHPLFRAGVVNCFSQHSDFEVVSQAADGNSCIAQLELFAPDILIVDLSMPGMSGFEVLQWVTKNMKQTRVFILSMHADINYVQRARDLGASGFMAKEDAQSELLAAIGQANGFYTSQSVGKQPLGLDEGLNDKEIAKYLRTVSDAEMRVLCLLTNNLTSGQIAEELGLSTRTIQAHRLSLASKLDISGPNKLLEFALLNRVTILDMKRQ